MDTRRSTCRRPERTRTRPSCGRRRCITSRPEITLIRLTNGGMLASGSRRISIMMPSARTRTLTFSAPGSMWMSLARRAAAAPMIWLTMPMAPSPASSSSSSSALVSESVSTKLSTKLAETDSSHNSRILRWTWVGVATTTAIGRRKRMRSSSAPTTSTGSAIATTKRPPTSLTGIAISRSATSAGMARPIPGSIATPSRLSNRRWCTSASADASVSSSMRWLFSRIAPKRILLGLFRCTCSACSSTSGLIAPHSTNTSPRRCLRGGSGSITWVLFVWVR